MRSKVKLLGPAILFALTAACVADQDGLKNASQFGEANRQTMAAQIIDPDPNYDSPVPTTSGDHAAQAVERYRTDKVKQPKRPTSTGSGSGSGSGGGGSSGGGN